MNFTEFAYQGAWKSQFEEQSFLQMCAVLHAQLTSEINDRQFTSLLMSPLLPLTMESYFLSALRLNIKEAQLI